MASRRIATVFGGSGFIGRYVVQRLARLDYVVRIATRDPEGARALGTQGRVGQVVPLAVQTGEDAAVARAVAGADAVVNLVGILFERRAGDFYRTHAEAPGRIARAAAAAGAAHLVHVSAIGADAEGDSLYGRSKAAGEAAVRQAFPTATILRPSIVFGPEDKFFNRFAGLSRVLPFVPVVGGSTRFQPVFVGDVADAVVAALQQESAASRTFELGGPRVATFRDLLGYMLEVTGRHRRIVEIPAGLAKLQATIGERLPNPPLTRDQLILLDRDNVVSVGAPGLEALGIVPKSLEAILPGYLTRYRAGGGRRAAQV